MWFVVSAVVAFAVWLLVCAKGEVSGMRERPAQLYLWIWGALLLVLGIGSLIVNPDFATGDAVSEEHLFGVLETNGWHGVAGALSGVIAVAFAGSRRWAPAVAAGIGAFAGVVPAAVFFLSGDDSIALGLIPVDITDAVLLHLVPGVVGLACAAPALVRRRVPLPQR